MLLPNWLSNKSTFFNGHYLINVRVPHFGEEAESRWRVWVVDGELDPSLRVREDTHWQHERQAVSSTPLPFRQTSHDYFTPNCYRLGKPFPLKG